MEKLIGLIKRIHLKAQEISRPEHKLVEGRAYRGWATAPCVLDFEQDIRPLVQGLAAADTMGETQLREQFREAMWLLDMLAGGRNHADPTKTTIAIAFWRSFKNLVDPEIDPMDAWTPIVARASTIWYRFFSRYRNNFIRWEDRRKLTLE